MTDNKKMDLNEEIAKIAAETALKSLEVERCLDAIDGKQPPKVADAFDVGDKPEPKTEPDATVVEAWLATVILKQVDTDDICASVAQQVDTVDICERVAEQIDTDDIVERVAEGFDTDDICERVASRIDIDDLEHRLVREVEQRLLVTLQRQLGLMAQTAARELDDEKREQVWFRRAARWLRNAFARKGGK